MLNPKSFYVIVVGGFGVVVGDADDGCGCGRQNEIEVALDTARMNSSILLVTHNIVGIEKNHL